jgi:hypothetical protein
MWIWIFVIIFVLILVVCFACTKENFSTNPFSYYDISWTDPNTTTDTYNVQITDTTNNSNVFSSTGQESKSVEFGKDCNPSTDQNCGKWATPYTTSVVASTNGLNSTASTMNFVSGTPKNPVGAVDNDVFLDVQWCEGNPVKCYRVD